MSIAKNLSREMNARAITADTLSERVGIDKRFITMYLRGKTKPAEDIVARLADGIGCPVERLVSERRKHDGGKIRPEDAAIRLKRSAQDIRAGLRMGVLPIGTAYKREGAHNYTYEIDPTALESYAQALERFWSR